MYNAGVKKKLIIALAVFIILALGLVFSKISEAPGGIIPEDSQETTATPAKTFDKSQYSLSDPASPWVVANKRRPLNPLGYIPADLVNAGNGQMLRRTAADALTELKAAAAKKELYILPLSGYRSYDTQVAVYASEVKAHGQATADTQSARPGHSEHQTGWAIDVGGGGCGIEDCFANTTEGKWLASNAHTYGFIIRYLPQKQAITGYRYEPWHIRYVGKRLAAELHKSGKTMEEFFDLGAAENYN